MQIQAVKPGALLAALHLLFTPPFSRRCGIVAWMWLACVPLSIRGQGIEDEEQGQAERNRDKSFSVLAAAHQPLPLSDTHSTQLADELEASLMVPGRRTNRYLACPTCQPEDRPFRLYAPLLFNHGDPNDSRRHIGKGQPLEGTSWLNRPVHGGWFIGGMIGDELIDGRIDQGENVFGGYRVGWDFDHYWGYELRLGFVNLPVLDSLSPPAPRDSSNLLVDVNLLHYPFGDARWRPYQPVEKVCRR